MHEILGLFLERITGVVPGRPVLFRTISRGVWFTVWILLLYDISDCCILMCWSTFLSVNCLVQLPWSMLGFWLASRDIRYHISDTSTCLDLDVTVHEVHALSSSTIPMLFRYRSWLMLPEMRKKWYWLRRTAWAQHWLHEYRPCQHQPALCCATFKWNQFSVYQPFWDQTWFCTAGSILPLTYRMNIYYIHHLTKDKASIQVCMHTSASAAPPFSCSMQL